MLAAPRVDRQAEWELKVLSPTAVSSPGEDLPPFPLVVNDMKRFETLQEDEPKEQIDDGKGQPPLYSNTGPSRFTAVTGTGGVGMEKQASASVMVAGIEWVDWYDCYKNFKEAKIRAEAEAAKVKAQREDSPRERYRTMRSYDGQMASPKEIDLGSNFDTSSTAGLTPTTSRDEEGGAQSGLRQRSMSIRSTLSAIDPKLSPTPKRAIGFERPRQSSSGSTRSTEVSSLTNGGKKKKNLVNKMEGWWKAVKSNFVPEGQHQPHRPSNLGPHISRRIPSLPENRRDSETSPITTPQPALLAPESIRQDSSPSLRQASSYANLQSRD